MATGLIRRPLTHLATAWRALWTGPLTSSSPEIARLWAAPPSSTGVGVNEQTALTFSAFWACVNAISTDVASLPLIHYKRTSGGGKEVFNDSKLYRLLHDEPNPEMTSMTMRQTVTAHALTWGNGYAEIERDGVGRPAAVWPLTPERVQAFRDPNTQLIGYHVTETDGSTATIPAMDMLHVPGLGFDGLVGYSVIAKARESIGLGLATERFGGTFFGNGATFGGVFEHPARLSEHARKNFQESVEGRHQGIDRAHRFMIVEEGMKYVKGNGIPPNDAQFLETRDHQIEEMCRWFRMPPHKIQHLLRATNNNIEQQSLEYYTDTLRPWLERWEQELERKLIHPVERRIQFVEHRIEGVLRGDLASRYAAYAVGRQWGWLSADDVREKENMNPLPQGAGQIYLVPVNMAPADRINELITAQIEAKKQPPAVAPGPDATPPSARALEALQAQIRTLEEKADALLKCATEAESSALTAKDVRVDELEAMATVLRAEAADARRQIAALTILKDEAERDATRAREEHDRLVAGAEALRLTTAVQIRDLEAAVAAGTLATDDAQRQIAALTLNRDTAAQTIAQIRGESAAQAATVVTEAEKAGAATTRAAAAEETADRLRVELDARSKELVEAYAGIGTVTAERDALQARPDEARLAELDSQLVSLRATVADKEGAIETTRALLEQRIAADAAAWQTERAAFDAFRAKEMKRLTSVMTAHRAIAVEAMGRLIRRETEKARRQQSSPDKLKAWVENFYVLHDDTCREMLAPIVQAHVAWLQSDEDPAALTQALVQAHIEDSTRQLRAVIGSESAIDFAAALEKLLTRWEADRAAAFADRLFQKEIAYVHAQR